MKAVLLGIFGILLLSGCAESTSSRQKYDAYAVYRAGCIRRWGPENKWTPEQELTFLHGLQEIRDEQLAETERRYAPAPYHPPRASVQPTFEPLPEYHHPAATGPTQITPDGRGGYTAWRADGSTQQAQPDGRGGYTIWDSDGHTHSVAPDGHGGWTVWNQ